MKELAVGSTWNWMLFAVLCGVVGVMCLLMGIFALLHYRKSENSDRKFSMTMGIVSGLFLGATILCGVMYAISPKPLDAGFSLKAQLPSANPEQLSVWTLDTYGGVLHEQSDGTYDLVYQDGREPETGCVVLTSSLTREVDNVTYMRADLQCNDR